MDSIANENMEDACIYCCGEEWDMEQMYIECKSNHPCCEKKIHKKCSGLTSKQFNKRVFSKKPWICIKCRLNNIAKPLTEKEIEEALKS